MNGDGTNFGLFVSKHVYLYGNYMHPYVCFICVRETVFVLLSVSMSVCIGGFVCEYHSFICLMQRRIQRALSTWRDKGAVGGGWILVAGNPLGLFGG